MFGSSLSSYASASQQSNWLSNDQSTGLSLLIGDALDSPVAEDRLATHPGTNLKKRIPSTTLAPPKQSNASDLIEACESDSSIEDSDSTGDSSPMSML